MVHAPPSALARAPSSRADLPAGPAWIARMPGAPRLAALGRTTVDAIGWLPRALGLTRPLLDPDWVVWMARRRTGLHALGSVAHKDGLARACASLGTEAGLGAFGELVVSSALVEGACNRLRYVDAQARVPQRFGVPLQPPIFVVGLPRSGTTFLHRLLCAVPGTRGIPLWQARRPIAGRVDRRRRASAWELGLLRAVVPEVMAKHAFELDSPEEAINLFEASLGWNPFLWRIAGCPAYVDWLLQQDATEPYRVFADLLRWIAAPTPDHRMVLKTPNHLGYLKTIQEILPQAIFVRTHRDPAKCIPSYASLSATMHGVAVGTPDRAMIGATSLRLWTEHARRAARSRVRVIDVDYRELVADPLDTVTRVFAEARLRFGPTARQAVADELSHRPSGAHGVHRYAAEDYALTAELIRRRYARAVGARPRP